MKPTAFSSITSFSDSQRQHKHSTSNRHGFTFATNVIKANILSALISLPSVDHLDALCYYLLAAKYRFPVPALEIAVSCRLFVVFAVTKIYVDTISLSRVQQALARGEARFDSGPPSDNVFLERGLGAIKQNFLFNSWI